jgi:hypothetical protein
MGLFPAEGRSAKVKLSRDSCYPARRDGERIALMPLGEFIEYRGVSPWGKLEE